jgi:amino acid adenylation domain-containing protein/non-ribosomal peptide synthase protein (TIGR01720 family)
MEPGSVSQPLPAERGARREAGRGVLEQRLATEREYWLAKLGGEPPLVGFAADYRAAGGPPERRQLPLPLPPATAERLLAACGGRDSLLLAALVAVTKLLLHKYTGAEDIVVGSTIHRRHGDVAELNRVLALRDTVTPEATVRAVLGAVKQTLAEAYEHQKFPYPLLLERLQPAAARGRTPLFSVGVLLATINDRRHADGMAAEVLLLFDRGVSGLSGVLEYDAGRFRAATMEAAARHFRHLLAEVLARPASRVGDLELIGDAERRELLAGWRAGTAAPPPTACVHELFAAQARRFAGETAIVAGGETLTYGELEIQANRLARALRRRGAGPGARVAILLEHGTGAVTAVLGVLKAGAAYVPLDPGHPPARIEHVLADSGACLVVTAANLASRLPASPAAFRLEAERQAVGREPGSAPAGADTWPGWPAYVIYTSGSTGLPKGVEVSHASLAGYLAWAERVYTRGERLSFPLFTSLSFDLTNTSLFLPLLTGGCLRVYPQRQESEVPLLAVLAEDRVDVVKLTPSHLELMRERDNRGSRIRRLIVGGEALAAPLAADVERSFGGGVEILNEYGPTEATVGCMLHRFAGDDRRRAGVPIGGPADGVTLHVLDRELRPVAENQQGELYIAGPGVARGYVGRPELTAERFLPCPALAGERWYRTGDLVRRLAGGALDFIGRRDEQVKLRGFRIELGEVRAALERHPDVRQGVVLLSREGAEPALVAYYAARREIAEQELRDFLGGSLLAESIPAFFVHLRRLPLNLNGKLDVKALPSLAAARQRARAGFVAPRNEAERVMTQIWSAVLGIPQIGVRDNFFQLGGDSIVGIRVIGRANQAGFGLAPRQIFQHQTVAELVAAAGTVRLAAAEQGAVTGAVPLTPIQLEFFAAAEPHPEHYNQALLLGVRRRPDGVPPALWRRATRLLLAHHDALRLRFTPAAGTWEQRLEPPGGPPPFTWIDLAALPPAARPAALAAAAAGLQGSLDLGRGPLVRLAFFAGGPAEDGRLLIAIHHLAVDGVSWRILLEDLETLLAAGEAGSDAPAAAALPAKTASFRAWALALRELAARGDLAAEEPYWRALGAAPPPRLPVDFPGGGNPEGAVREVTVALDREATRALLHEVPGAYHTEINDVLLTALAEAAAAWSGERRLLLALEGHGREEVAGDLDLSRTVGWFTAVFPVLLDLRGRAEPGAALRAVKEQLRAVPRRGVGFGILRQLGSGAARAALGGLAEPELSFNYLGRFDELLGNAGWLFPAAEAAGPTSHPGRRRRRLIDVIGLVGAGRLQMRFVYGERLHRRETVAALADCFARRLETLIAHCLARPKGGFTPSDFPLAALRQQELDALLAGRAAEDVYPLSPLQEGLLFHSIAAPSSGVYFRQMRCALRGPLDAAAFAAACQDLVDRHGILRTAFVWEGLRAPLQLVLRQALLQVALHDWRAAAAAPGEPLDELCRADRERGFDLGQPPLMRISLAAVAPDLHWLVWSFHHLVCDGWSFPLMVSEVLAAYAARRAGREPAIAAPRPFHDYIAWLRRQDLAAAERFWRRQLAGFEAPTPLPLDRPPRGERAPEPGEAAERLDVLAPLATAELAAWAKSQQLTVNTAVQGAWALLLGRHAGDPDVVFGTVTSGRSAMLPDIDSMLGVFINTLPLRVPAAGRLPLGDWLRALQARHAEAREHEYSPLAQVQRWSDVPRGQPLFHSLLAFENYPVAESVRGQGGGLEVEQLEFPEATHYPLTLMVAPGAALPVRLIFDRRWCEPATAERLLRHFITLLGGAAGHAGAALDLPLLSAAERQQLLWEWNDTAAAVRPALIHQLFEEQAARHPERPAAICGGGTLSYGELNRQANQVAHWLRAAGLGRGAWVAIHLERSLAMLPALLGTLKAGAAYVPLDADYPRARIEWIAARLGIRCMLTQHGRLAAMTAWSLPSLTHWLCLDAPSGGPAETPRGAAVATPGDLARQPEDDPTPLAGPLDVAYVIFTSGSTGTPKGAVLAHAPVVNLIDWVNRRFAVGADDRLLFITSLCFDLSVYDVFGLLAAGGSIHVATRAEARDPWRLERLLREAGITFWDSAPAALQQLAPLWAEEAAAPVAPREHRLRLVFLSGDWVPVGLPDAVRRAFPGAQVVALGGATEAAIWSNSFPVGEVPADWPSIPYGRPIPNARYHVLDAAGTPCAIGAAGDLHIAGECLAMGYLDEPGLTAERFGPDPWSARPGGRSYRTGDRARFGADGNIEFLGRLDHQVKVRGFRIELGEIEAALLRHAEVREAVVVVREDQPGHRRLVAYYVPRQAAAPGGPELRGFLAGELPEYMLPAAYVRLAAWPTTANGKLDRQTLPAPEAPEAAAAGAPRDALEGQLAAVWAEVLRVERIGVQDNFFELGGDSILSIQIVSRAAGLGLRLAPADLFTHPTVAELAAVLRAAGPAAARSAPAAAEAASGPLPLTPAQHWFFAARPADPHHFNQALLLDLRRPLAAARLRRAAARLAQHHAALRLRFRQVAGGAWAQEIAARDGERLVAEIDLGALAGAAAAAAIEAAAAAIEVSLDLGRGPLWRLALFRGGGEPDRLLVAVHHLAVDGVSWRVLLEDLAHLCERQEEALAPATTSLRRWAELLGERARSGELAAETAYWAAAGEDGPALPRDFGDATPDANTNASAERLVVTLDAESTRALLQEVPRVYRAQAHEALLSALAEACRGWTGSPAVTVEVEAHGREELGAAADLSRTVGWLTAFYPVRLDLAGVAGPGEALRRVKETLRSVPGRGLGYGLLRHLAGSPEIAAQRPPEVSFNYLGQLDQALPADSMLAPSALSCGATESPRQLRRSVLAVNASVLAGCLRVSFTWSSRLHRRDTVASLGASFQAALQGLVEHCRSPRAGGFTPSDFPLAGLGQAELDRLLGNDRRVEDVYPLAPLQEGLLFHALEAPRGEDLYFEQLSCSLHGELDTAAFARALQQATERHPILRTAFFWQQLREPLQVVYRGLAADRREADWRPLGAAELAARQAAELAADRAAGCALSRAPLVRLGLFRVEQAGWWLLLSFHHLLLDGWSLALLLADLFALYAAERRGEGAPPPPRPYRDYVAWVRGQDLGAAEAYWRRTLAGLGAPTPLPTDRTAGLAGRQRRDFSEVNERLGEAAGAALGRLAKREQVTASTLVQGAWALLLARSSSEREALFGVVSSGRPAALAGAESMIGLFINTLPARVPVPARAPLGAWLRGLQERQLEARQYEHTPLAQVRGWSEVAAGLPLFDSIVVFENFPVTGESAGGSGLALADLRFREASSYPFTLLAKPAGGSDLDLAALFDTRLLDAATARRMLGQLAALLDGMARDPEGGLEGLTLLTAAERHQLVREWGATPAEGAAGGCLHHFFQAQAARTPGLAALAWRHELLSYGELAARVGALAARLRRAGVGPEVPVGIYLERTPALVVALLAVLEAGGCYLPLEPAHPLERASFMLADCGAALVVSDAGLAPRMAAAGRPVLVLDAGGRAMEALETGPRAAPDAAPDAAPAAGGAAAGSANLAYLIYTSGSTGQPKGVAVEHRSAVALVDWALRAFTAAELAGVLAATSIGFDLSVFEIFVPLACGGAVALADSALAPPPAALPITLLNTVPSVLGELLGGGRLPATLQVVNLAGEALPGALAERLHERAGGIRLYNLYGPSEDTTYSTFARIDPGTGAPPIGRPIGGTRALVLDAGGQLLPLGCAGELYLGGAGLARGYCGRPDLTAASFLPDPLGAAPGDRLYRTGDRVRWRADGGLDFLGRLDRQVKLRGFRIEPGEIEACLAGHPAVAAAAVVVAAPVGGAERRLAAFVVPRAGEEPADADLRAHLLRSLPAYMVPASFERRPALPLTANGKIDRRALAAAAGRPRGEAQFVAPESEIERALAVLWQEELHVERVGRHDSFFELGGHSLLMLRLYDRIQERFATPLRMVELFELTTVSAMARRLAAPAAEGAAAAGTDRAATRLAARRTAPARRSGRPPLPRGQGGSDD